MKKACIFRFGVINKISGLNLFVLEQKLILLGMVFVARMDYNLCVISKSVKKGNDCLSIVRYKKFAGVYCAQYAKGRSIERLTVAE